MNPAMKAFNAAVEEADLITGYRMDWASPYRLFEALLAMHQYQAADRLLDAAYAVGYFQNGTKTYENTKASRQDI